MQQLLARIYQNIRRLLKLLLRELPLPVIDRIPHAREKGFIIARPQRRRKNDVFVLFATRELWHPISMLVSRRQDNGGDLHHR